MLGIPTPDRPRTAIVLGRIDGGTSASTIATRAALQFEVRSESGSTVRQLLKDISDIIEEVSSQTGADIGMNIFARRRPERRVRRRERRGRPARSHGDRQRQPTTLLALMDSLKRLIGRLSCGPAHSEWSGYAGSHSYAAADFERKQDFVRRHSAARRPGLTWDLGANTGVFARIAARHSRLVVAADRDAEAVELLYREVRSGGPQNVIPLVLDVANLSPGQGWAGREWAAFDARRSPDLVLCLALVHHVRVAANIPLPRFVDWLRSLDAAVMLEFVGRDDEMFRKLLAHKTEDYADYTAENFERQVRRRFSVRDRLPLKGGSRELFLLEPAGCSSAPASS